MADSAVAPAAPPTPAAAPAAPALKDNELMVPYQVGDGLDDITPDDDEPVLDDGAVAPVVPAPAPAEPVKPTRLQKFRNADGTLNEDLIEQVAQAADEAGAVVSEIQRAYNNDPVYRLNYIKWRQSTGQVLSPEQHAELAASKTVETAEKKAAPTPEAVRAWLKTKCKEMETTHSIADIMDFRDEMMELHIHKPQREKEQAEQAKQRNAEQQRAHVATVRSDLAEAAKAYPDLVVADPSLPQGFRITDSAVYNGVADLMSVKKPMTWRIKTVLADLGRGTPPVRAAKPGVKPTLPVQAPRSMPMPRKLKANEFAVPARIVGEQ